MEWKDLTLRSLSIHDQFFSGLAGVYGLELIPSNMIERIEVVRGGGSALYGSNAIAGTVNLILKDPITNSYEFGTTAGIVGLGVKNSQGGVPDYNVNLNSSVVSSDNRTGMSLYGTHRDRGAFDANGDNFTELSQIKNTTIGTRVFHRFNQKNKITLDYFSINEDRRGGNDLDNIDHMSDITESLEHKVNTAALAYDQFLRKQDKLTVYASAQHILRNSYYGAEQSLADYGRTKDLSYNAGFQYTMKENKSTLVAGAETTGAKLNDIKHGFPDFENAVIDNDEVVSIPYISNTLIANQQTMTSGVFAQYDRKFGLFKLSLGGRYDNYAITDLEDSSSKKTGNVFSPRANVLVDLTKFLQMRASYSQGFRAPQIFDEDLHIESSGSRQVIHRNDPDLIQETSHSASASFDLKKEFGSTSISFLAEGFYTLLQNPFVNDYGEADENGLVITTRVNAAAGATVQGLNFEFSVFPGYKLALRSGFTLQQSLFEEEQDFNEKRFLRTPNDYGFIGIDYTPTKDLSLNLTGTYTGSMLVPFFGVSLPDPDTGELRESNPFFDMGFKARYNIKINGAKLQVFAGVKNIFNSYQNDFDSGVERDPGYIYGPATPRTIYAGIKLGNLL